MFSCREYRVSEDPSLRLEFSVDTLRFDTVFTEQGSSTARVMVYNRNKNAVLIDRVWLANGTAFQVNIDGEPELSRLTDLQLNGGDSLFMFVRVDIDPTNDNNPVLLTDRLHFHLTNDVTQTMEMEAYGQDVVRVGYPGKQRTDTLNATFTANKPYLIFDTLVVNKTLTLQPGAQLYMHSGACIYALGDVKAKGTLSQPILIRGDRLDKLFEHVPYLYAGGSWDGIYLQADKKQSYELSYVDILSGNVGLYCFSTYNGSLPSLLMDGCRIHNHTQYGLALRGINARVTNTEISNCGSYCIYCEGGTHHFIHTTVASYFGSTDVRIQSASKEDVAAVYIKNLSKNEPKTKTSFYNSIITGSRTHQLVLATPIDRYYEGSFVGNYLKSDSLATPNARDNIYWTKEDTTSVFRNTFFKYKEYTYYDFRLDSLSPAIEAGDSLTAVPYPTDRNGVSRSGVKPDAGCYQYLP
jgi:hypothetical protein